jgi:hypothetical protein
MVWQIVHNVDVDKAKEIPHNNRSPFCLLLFTFVYFCLLLFTFVYFCLLLFTFVYFCLLLFTFVYFCLFINNRSPFFEVQVVANNDNVQSIKRVDEMPSPRVIKTHLPLEMLPPKLLDTCKVFFTRERSSKGLLFTLLFFFFFLLLFLLLLLLLLLLLG